MSDRVEFKLPAGFQLPEGKGEGDDIQVLATLEIKGDGTACLVKLGDVPMDGYGDDETDAAPEEKGFAANYMDQMKQAGMGQA